MTFPIFLDFLAYHDDREEEFVLELLRVDELRQRVEGVEGLEPDERVELSVPPHQLHAPSIATVVPPDVISTGIGSYY